MSMCLAFIGGDCYGISDTAIKTSRTYFALQQPEEVVSIYNWEDYIKPDEDENGDGKIEDDEKGLITLFEEYCLNELGKNVRVTYSTFDTNETMLAELKTGKATYDAICPSDYIIQKMIADDLIAPYDDNSTPDYDKYVSPFVKNKIDSIKIGDKTGIVSSYARGYMWGTLGILYNDGYKTLASKGITSKEMDKDMKNWLSLWDEKYKNLLAIKDSMRDTYAVGIQKTYRDEFVSLQQKHDNSEIDDETYNEAVTEIFNRCDDKTLDEVRKDLLELKDNAFGFEVDTGKTDMAQGKNFAINVAWSGDAAYAMDQADEYSEKKKDDPSFTPTVLKYSIPDTGANIWFDGWVLPKTNSEKAGKTNTPEEASRRRLAEEFINFVSKPANASMNMNYIGYTPVVAGDDILTLVRSWYDLRWDDNLNDGEGGIDESAVDEYEKIDANSIIDLDEEVKSDYYYTKDISYFFRGTLEENTEADCVFYLTADMKDRQFDTQYPDYDVIPSLTVMADFGAEQNASLLMMWENVKNTTLPTWAYYLILAVVVVLIVLLIAFKIRRHLILKKRRERKLSREKLEKRQAALIKILTDNLLTNKK